MKQRSTTPVSKILLSGASIVAAFVLAISAIPLSPQSVQADQYDEQIAALKQEISGYQERADDLKKKANTLQNRLDQLAADRAVIQREIDLYTKKHDQLKAEIIATKKRIQDNRAALGETIADLSIDGEVSPLMLLASSSNIGDFIDKQAYRETVRDSLVVTIKEIEIEKKKLDEQKEAVEKVLNQQAIKKRELVSKENAQAELLRRTRGNESAYQNLISSNRGEIRKLQRQQEEARQRAANQWGSSGGGYVTTGGTGGYPWANAPYPCWAGCSHGADPWDLYKRECTSYAAWRTAAAGYGVRPFAGRGHAREFPSTTSSYTKQSYGRPVNYSGSYKGGQMVVNTHYHPGHVMYVESISGNGSIRISEYNFAGPGIYSERVLQPGDYASYTFIQFPKLR